MSEVCLHKSKCKLLWSGRLLQELQTMRDFMGCFLIAISIRYPKAVISVVSKKFIVWRIIFTAKFK